MCTSTPESDRPEEMATQPQLQNLFNGFSVALVRLGELDDDDDEPVVGSINGYPVYKYLSMLDYSLEISDVALKRVIPRVMRVLEINGQVTISYAPGYYCAGGDNENPETTFDAPEVSLVIPKGKTDKRFVIEDLGELSEGNRFRGERVIDINDGTPFAARIVRAVIYGESGNAELDRELGLNQITTDEYEALNDIAINLDRLVELS